MTGGSTSRVCEGRRIQRPAGHVVNRLLRWSRYGLEWPTGGAAVSGEIEVKYRVLDHDGLLKALAAREISLSPGTLQDDQAYAQQVEGLGRRIGVTFVRLRTQDGRHTFTTKTPVD